MSPCWSRAATRRSERTQVFSWVQPRGSRLTQREVRLRGGRRIGAVVTERAVNEDVVGQGIDTEGVAVPNDHIAHFSCLERAGAIRHADGLRRIGRQPFDGAFGWYVESDPFAVGDCLRRLLVQALDAFFGV